MKQRRISSLIESCGLIAVGFIINTALNYYALPLFGLHPTAGDSIAMAVMFTAVAIPRSYLWRRLFEWLRVTGRLP